MQFGSHVLLFFAQICLKCSSSGVCLVLAYITKRGSWLATYTFFVYLPRKSWVVELKWALIVSTGFCNRIDSNEKFGETSQKYWWDIRDWQSLEKKLFKIAFYSKKNKWWIQNNFWKITPWTPVGGSNKSLRRQWRLAIKIASLMWNSPQNNFGFICSWLATPPSQLPVLRAHENSCIIKSCCLLGSNNLLAK